MALILRRRGIDRVRPLAGGFRAWRERGYPTISVVAKMDISPARSENVPTPG